MAPEIPNAFERRTQMRHITGRIDLVNSSPLFVLGMDGREDEAWVGVRRFSESATNFRFDIRMHGLIQIILDMLSYIKFCPWASTYTAGEGDTSVQDLELCNVYNNSTR